MLGSDWRKLTKIVGLGLAGLLCIVIVLLVGYGLGSSAGYFDAQADGYAAQYPSDTDQRVDRCFAQAQPSRNTQACVEEAVKAAHESRRAESDLSAQRQMAQWAWWLLIATLVQVPLTGLGLIFLLRTIWQGQEALEHARQVSHSDLRAYMVIQNRHLSEFESGSWRIQASLSNVGNTPAHDVLVYFDTFYVPFPLQVPLPELDFDMPIKFDIAGPHTERNVWCSIPDLTDARRTEVEAWSACYLARIQLVYKTFSGESVTEPVINALAIGPGFERLKLSTVNDYHYADYKKARRQKKKRPPAP